MSQPLPLVEQLKNLEHRQEIDLKIDSLRKNQNSLPESLKLLDDSLSKLKASLTTKNSQIAEIEKVNRQTLAALDLNRDRLSRSNQKLEAVHNSQEFQAANKEIEQLKKLNVTLEEQNKKSTTDIEALRTEAGALSEQISKLQKDRDSQSTVLSGQSQQFQTDIDSLLSKRTEYSVNVEKRILTQYDRVRVARNGLGIVPAVGGRCKGCNMMVPPQLFNEVQRGSTLHSCPCCHRLLYIPGMDATKQEAGSTK